MSCFCVIALREMRMEDPKFVIRRLHPAVWQRRATGVPDLGVYTIERNGHERLSTTSGRNSASRPPRNPGHSRSILQAFYFHHDVKHCSRAALKRSMYRPDFRYKSCRANLQRAESYGWLIDLRTRRSSTLWTTIPMFATACRACFSPSASEAKLSSQQHHS